MKCEICKKNEAQFYYKESIKICLGGYNKSVVRGTLPTLSAKA